MSATEERPTVEALIDRASDEAADAVMAAAEAAAFFAELPASLGAVDVGQARMDVDRAIRESMADLIDLLEGVEEELLYALDPDREDVPGGDWEGHYRLHLLKVARLLGVDVSYFEEVGEEDEAIIRYVAGCECPEPRRSSPDHACVDG